MKTILVIAQTPALASALNTVLDREQYRILHETDLQDNDIFNPAGVDLCVLDADLTNVQPIRVVERMRKMFPTSPLIVFTNQSQWEYQEEAYLLGATHVLNKPVRAKLLTALLERIWATTGTQTTKADFGAASYTSPKLPASGVSPYIAPQTLPAGESNHASPKLLELFREHSQILSHSLSSDALLKEFLLRVRVITRVNRAAIFLRNPETRTLRSACAVGLAHGFLEQFELSLKSGIGGFLQRYGRILRRDTGDSHSDPQIQREFELLSAQIAVPILDRESLIGVAVFDGRITGEPFSSDDLALLFHLLEQIGMAIRNVQLHEEVGSNNKLMTSVLKHLHSACIVVDRELRVLHSNATAATFFGKLTGFSDLPQNLGSRIFEVLNSGVRVENFRFEMTTPVRRVLHITITPIRKTESGNVDVALFVADDFTQIERLQTLEVETANLRLVKQMAERLAHEIGNAVVPLSTHQQLLAEQGTNPEFQKSLGATMEDAVKRVTRLVNQMRFLAQDTVGRAQTISVKEMIENAFKEARIHHVAQSVLMQFEGSGEVKLAGDPTGLQHAFAEIILNALQANAGSSQVQVRAKTEIDSAGSRWAKIEVLDNGTGFTSEAAQKGAEPFYTTRTVGLGLGLAVSNKIIQTHHGRLEIPTPQIGHPGIVCVSLPLEANPVLS
jgi:signal transduction histidine kinase/DNA-binding NarL/FixJ family response regulator